MIDIDKEIISIFPEKGDKLYAFFKRADNGKHFQFSHMP